MICRLSFVLSSIKNQLKVINAFTARPGSEEIFSGDDTITTKFVVILTRVRDDLGADIRNNSKTGQLRRRRTLV